MGISIGQTLKNGSYLIEKKLVHEYFYTTYLSKRNDGSRWIMKVLDLQSLSSLTSAERDRLSSMFWQESTRLAQCSGAPHIVRAEMPFKEDDLVCLPIEYVQGNDLGTRPQPILSEEAALEYVRQIGEALTIVHAKKLVHRNIRPANIFLRIQGGRAEAVLTNFALAMDSDTKLTRTRRSELVDGFSPIELYSRGNAITPCTDVYALAATLYELLTGEMPPSAEKLKEAEDKGLSPHTLISPQMQNPDISGKTVKAIRSGMALRPETRPQSVAKWLHQLKISTGQSDNSNQDNVNWAKWQTVWGAIAAIFGLLVGIPAWLSLRNPDTTPIPQEPAVTQEVQEELAD